MMVLDRFSGGNDPEGWILRAEHYFTYLGFSEQDWLPLPSFYLDGAALTWFTWLFRNKQFYDWKHFKEKFAHRFPQPSSRDWVGRRLAHSAEVCFTYGNSSPVVSHATLVSRFPFLDQISKSYSFESTYDTGSSIDHVFDKLPVKYTNVDSIAVVTGNTTEIELPEDVETPQIGDVDSVKANMIHEPSSITATQMFDDILRTTVNSNIQDLQTNVHEVERTVTTVATVYEDCLYKETKVPLRVLHEMDVANDDEEETSHDNVTLFGKSPSSNTSGFLVTFASKETAMSSATSRLAKIDNPFAATLWFSKILCWYNSLEEFYRVNQNGVPLYLDFSLHNCNWVDTGQECNLPSFLSSNTRRCDSEEKIQEVLQEIVVSTSKHSPYTRVVRLLFAMFGLVHKARFASSYIVFDPGPNLDYVAIYAIDSTLGDGNSIEEGTVTVLFERPGAKFPIEQVLSVQMGITIDVCNRLGTSVYCYMGTCTSFHLKFDVTVRIIPSCSFVDNWLDTGQDVEVDPLVLLSVEPEELTQVSHEKSWLLPIRGCEYILLQDENFMMADEVSSETKKSVPAKIFLIEFVNPAWAYEFALIMEQPLLHDFQLVVLSCLVLNLELLEGMIVEVVGVSNVSYSLGVMCLQVQRDSLELLSESSSNEDMNYSLAHARNIYSQWGLGPGQLLEEMYITSTYCYGQLISSGIFALFSSLGRAILILTWCQFCRNQLESNFPFDPGTSFLSAYRGAIEGADFIGTHTIGQPFKVTILDNFHNSVGDAVASVRDLVGLQLAQHLDIYLKDMLRVTFSSVGMEYGVFFSVFWELTLVLHLRYMFGMLIVRKGEGSTFPLCLLIYRFAWINSFSSRSRSTQLPYTSHDLRRNAGYMLRNTNALSSWDGIVYVVEACFVNHGNYMIKLAFALHWFRNKEAWEYFGTSADQGASLLLINKLTVPVDAHVYSNLEDKVHIGAGSIVMNGPRPILEKQPNIILNGIVWDPGR